MMEMVSGENRIYLRRAKLQSIRHHQQTNNQLCTGRMTFLSPNQQRQSTVSVFNGHFTGGRGLASTRMFPF